ncbi:MAG: D-alanine--D-alanine ligase family protein [Chloroflexota bacterium]|nr:D-alanine--D-alanine ligase family protein [Chloroflexota bacterium]
MSRRLKVAVLFGGRSGEHEVSLESARSVMEALDPSRYEIIPVGITRNGAWIVGGDPLRALQDESFSESWPAAILPDPTRKGLNRLQVRQEEETRLSLLSRVDVVFPVLHGTFGEDGTVQGLLELANVPYVGAGVLASALAMDKIVFKHVCRDVGLPVVEGMPCTRRRWGREPEAVLAEIEARLTYPLFTKPANLGSSVGISKCHDRTELRAGLNEAARYDRRILVEVAVPAAREIEVSVLGNEAPTASVPGEILPSREFYSYESKYLDTGEDASGLLIPAPLDAALTEQLRAMAIKAYQAIDGAGMARVDFLLSGETGALYLNEINTIPGFTKISMYPKLWAATGVDYPSLLTQLIELALERHAENARSERVFRPSGE